MLKSACPLVSDVSIFGFETEKVTVNSTDDLEISIEPKPNKSNSYVRSEKMRAFIEQQLLFAIAGIVAETKHSWSKEQWFDLENVVNYITPLNFSLDYEEKKDKFDENGKPLKDDALLKKETDFNKYLYELQYSDFKGSTKSSKETTKAFRRFIVLRCIQLFDDKTVWKSVKAIATNLIEKRILTRDEIRSIINRVCQIYSSLPKQAAH